LIVEGNTVEVVAARNPLWISPLKKGRKLWMFFS